MDDFKLKELISDEKVVDALESKNHLNLAKFLGKEMCGFTENDEKYIDLFWDPTFNKSWIYASEEIVNEQFGYKKAKNMMTHFHEKLLDEFEENIDYKEVDKTNELVEVYSRNSGSKDKRGGALKKYYIITGETYKALLSSAQTQQGKLTRRYFIKVESLSNITNQLIFKYIEQVKDKQIEEMKHKVLALTSHIHNEEKLVKDGWVYIATSKVYSAQNQYRLGRCEVLNKRMQNYQVGRAKNDELYYVFMHNCANPGLLEIIFQKLLKKYRDAPTKDIYVIQWQVLEKFMKEICKLYDKQIATTNILIDDNLKNKQALSAPKPSNLKSLTALAMKIIMPKTTKKPTQPPVQSPPVLQPPVLQPPVPPPPQLQHVVEEIEQRMVDNWIDNGYFISMYDILQYCGLPYKYDKDCRKSFKAKLELRGLILATDIDELNKDYCIIKQKVNGSALYSNVPYLSTAGFTKYYNHKKTTKLERTKLRKMMNLLETLESDEEEEEEEIEEEEEEEAIEDDD